MLCCGIGSFHHLPKGNYIHWFPLWLLIRIDVLLVVLEHPFEVLTPCNLERPTISKLGVVLGGVSLIFKNSLTVIPLDHRSLAYVWALLDNSGQLRCVLR